MRITQGAFSFLPDLTDEQIAAQIRYCLEHGWAMSVEYTDDPHPRNSYWEMWGLPMFDLDVDDVEVVLREVRACREAHPDHYVKLSAYDSSLGRQTTALSFIVGRPVQEPGYRLERTDAHDRVMRFEIRPYALDRPGGRRYRIGVAAVTNGNGSGEHGAGG
ncbi:MAG TPA: ribulose bisphosphate carboxylase small subunit [Solirubrobacteraceae bacterium]|nr:ribulose bisphosphate carboxylase small subunit [Solirubrobacteraceae bacterium]